MYKLLCWANILHVLFFVEHVWTCLILHTLSIGSTFKLCHCLVIQGVWLHDDPCSPCLIRVLPPFHRFCFYSFWVSCHPPHQHETPTTRPWGVFPVAGTNLTWPNQWHYSTNLVVRLPNLLIPPAQRTGKFGSSTEFLFILSISTRLVWRIICLRPID